MRQMGGPWVPVRVQGGSGTCGGAASSPEGGCRNGVVARETGLSQRREPPPVRPLFHVQQVHKPPLSRPEQTGLSKPLAEAVNGPPMVELVLMILFRSGG